MTAWDHALSRYDRPDVQAICLELQDAHGQCVPLLLWRLWTLDESRAVDDGLVVEAAAFARNWSWRIVAPLRSVRRSLKAPSPPAPTAALVALGCDIQAAELAAERLLLDALESLTPPPGARPAPADALDALVAAWGTPAPEALLRRLRIAAA